VELNWLTYQNLPSKAGVDKDNSPLATELAGTEADKVVELPERIHLGGWRPEPHKRSGRFEH
jgi:hypothetical protein